MGWSHSPQTCHGACVFNSAIQDHERRLNQSEFRPWERSLFPYWRQPSERKRREISVSRGKNQVKCVEHFPWTAGMVGRPLVFQPTCLGFESQIQHHVWVELVKSVLDSETFSPCTPVVPWKMFSLNSGCPWGALGSSPDNPQGNAI